MKGRKRNRSKIINPIVDQHIPVVKTSVKSNTKIEKTEKIEKIDATDSKLNASSKIFEPKPKNMDPIVNALISETIQMNLFSNETLDSPSKNIQEKKKSLEISMLSPISDFSPPRQENLIENHFKRTRQAVAELNAGILPGTQAFHKDWEILGEIGQGGNGIVYIVNQRGFDSLVRNFNL